VCVAVTNAAQVSVNAWQTKRVANLPKGAAMYDKVYLKCRLKRIAVEIDRLRKKATAQHLGGLDSLNLRKLTDEQTKFSKLLKQEVFKERAEKRDGKATRK
jgi:hypothetical protein